MDIEFVVLDLEKMSLIALGVKGLINPDGKTKYLFPLPHQQVDLHLSKALQFSLDPYNLQLHFFLG